MTRAVALVTVRGSSMAPTFRDRQRVLVWRRGAYRVGDVIVFAAPAGGGSLPWRIKRVSAVAGDEVPDWVAAPESRVPAGTVVVHGDGARSQDSRQLGFIPVGSILGRVIGHKGRPASEPDGLTQE